MIRIGICDDDIQFTGRIEKIIKRLAKDNNIHADIDVFFDGVNLLEHMKAGNIRYDLIFMDIEMEGMNGLETAHKIRESDEIVLLIYITSYESYALEAFEVHPFQFLLKPLDEKQLCHYFYKAYERIMSGDFYFNYKYKKDFYKILVKDIMYFESKKRLIRIHKADGTISEFYGKLNNIEAEMQNRKVDFWRIHQSYLVNAKYIIRKAYNHVEMMNNEKLLVTEDRRKKLNSCYIKLMEEEMLE